MATEQDVQNWVQKYGSATAGGVNIVNDSGEIIGNVPYSEETGKAMASGGKLYKTSDGSWTTTGDVKFSLNKDTGEITVTAPKFFTDRDVYKETIKPQLEKISANYQIDPEYKYASSTNDDETITAEQFIQRLNDDFSSPEIVKQFQEIGKETEEMKSKGFSDWTDKDSEISLYGNNDLVENAKDDDRVYVADFGDVNFFQNAASYDKDTGTISYEDFKKIFSKKEHSDEEIEEKYRRMQQVSVEGELNSASGMTAAQYARTKAAYRLYQNTSPEVGVLKGAADQISAVFMGVMNSVEDSLFGFAADLGISPIGPPSVWTTVGSALSKVSPQAASVYDYVKPIASAGLSVAEFTDEAWDKAYSLDTEKREILSDSSIATRTVASLGTDLIQLAGVGSAARAGRTAVKAATGAKVAKAEGNVAKAIVGLEKNTSLKNLANKISGLTVEDIMAGTKISLETAKAADVSASTLQAIRTYNEAQRILKTTAGLSKAARLGFNAISFTAESFVSTIIIEPYLLKKAIAGDHTGEVAKELWGQLAIDTAVIGGIKGVAGAVKGFRATTIGAAVNTNATIRLARLEVKLTDVKNGMLNTITKNEDQATRILNYLNTPKEANKSADKIRKGSTLGLNEKVTQRKKDYASRDTIKWIGKDLEEVRAQVKRAEVARIGKVEQAQIAVDRYQRSVDVEVRAAIHSSPDTERAYDEFMEQYSKLVRLDRSMGSSMGKAMTPSGQVRLLSQDTADYLGGKYNIAYYTNKVKATGKPLSESERLSLADAERQVETFLNRTKDKPALRQAADDYYAKQQTAYKEFTTYFAERGLLSVDDIESKRLSGIWGPEGDEYIRQQRIKKPTGSFSANKKDIRGSLQEMQAGTGSFADPVIVFSDWLAKNCDKLNRQNVLRMLKGDEYRVLASTTETMIARNASHAAQVRFDKNVSQSIDELIEGMTAKGVFTKLSTAQKGEQLLAKQESVQKKAKVALGRAKASAPRVSANDRTVFIAGLSDEDLAGVSTKLIGYNKPSEYMADLVGGKYGVPKKPSAAQVFENPRDAGDNYWRPLWDEELDPGMTYREYYRKEKDLATKVVEVSPDEYLKMLQKGGHSRDVTHEELASHGASQSYRDDILEGKPLGTPDFTLRPDGKIDAQEGRHRAEGARLAGVEKIPVMISYRASADNVDEFLKGVDYKDVTEKFRKIVTEGKPAAEEVSGVGYTSDEVFDYWLSTISKKDVATTKRIITNYLETEGRKIGKNENVLTYDNYMRLADQDELFERMIMSEILSNNVKYRDSDVVKSMALEAKQNERIFTARESCRKESRRVTEIMKKYGIGDGYAEGEAYKEIQNIIDDEIGNAIKSIENTDNGRTIDAVLKASGVEGDIEKEYIALKSLLGHKTEFLKSVREQAKKEIVTLSGKGSKITKGEQESFALAIDRLTEDSLMNKFGDLHQKLIDIKSPVVDQKHIFDEVKKIRKKIVGFEKDSKAENSGIVPLGSKDGELEYIEVDPLLATIVQSNNAYARSHLGAGYNLLYMQSKLFRLGTTGLRLKSWLMQTSRDGIGLYSGVGTLRTLGNCADALSTQLGPDLIREFKAFDEKTYNRIVDNIMNENRKLSRDAAENVVDEEINLAFAKELANRELTLGYNRASTATQTEAYRMKRAAGETLRGEQIDQTTLDAFSAALDSVMRAKTIGKTKIPNPLHLNEFREDYMRRLAYANTYTQSMKEGYGVANSRIHAEFIMNNATTNFSRMPVHLQNLQNTVPYLGSAINGTKSFYRLLAMDPIGVMGRLIGGIMIPAFALTCFSLSTEQNREIYKNLSEYEKDDNLVFVIDGQVIAVPIPQEMSSVFAPLRHFVENLYNVSNHEFWELSANTLLGISPIDMTGFLAIDAERLSGDPTFTERFSTGFSKMIAQLTPPIIKTGIMLTTGKDPYTGKDIDTSYVTRDPDTGEREVIDYKSGVFAKWCASLFGDEANAYIFETIFSNFMGNTGKNFLDDLTGLAQGVPTANNLYEAADAYRVQVYNRADTEWRAAFKKLQRQKDDILNSEDYKAIQSQLYRATGDAKDKLLADLNDMLTPLYENTLTVTNNLVNKYPTAYTKNKFAAVLGMLNLASDQDLPGAINLTREINSDTFLAGNNMAIETMWKLGFKSTNDTSIFGYVKKNTDGSYEIVYRTPLSILEMDNAQIAQTDIHSANIKSLMKQNNIMSIRSAYYNDPEYQKAQKAGKAALNEYKAKHNEEVVKILAPYVEKYGVDAVIKGRIVDLLESDYIYVKNKYKAKEYLKSIFGEED